MSFPEDSTVPNRRCRPTTWYFGIPWVITYVKEVFRNEALSTTDSMTSSELERRQKAIEESAQTDELGAARELFHWAAESIGEIINKDPRRFTFSRCDDPLWRETKTIHVLVLRKKIVKTKEDLATSEDLYEKSPPTDEQVEKLRSKGWTVEWYKEVDDLE